MAPCSDSQLTPPFLASEAHDLIETQLSRVPSIDAGKKIAFQTALNRLKQNLNTSIIESQSTLATPTVASLDNISIPPVSLIHWMVQSNDTGRSVCSNDFMPFTSRSTIAAMGKDVLDSKTPHKCNLASFICVSAYAFYFLQEIVLSDVRRSTGLESRLRLQANGYFTAARVAASHIRTQMPSSLPNLQALTYGVSLAQEAGDFVAAWLLTEAASKMCIELGLHKRMNVFSNSATMAREAYYCFSTNYKNDKGLAMNLGRPAFIQDSLIEIDILRPPHSSNDALDNFRVYLELAKIQSRVIEELRPAKGVSLRSNILAGILSTMDGIWHLNMQLQSIKQANQDPMHDSTMDSTLVDFAFHPLKTVIFHSSSERNQGGLNAARAALEAVQRIRELSKCSQYNSTYMRSSFAHWTVLYYPFTPFFVLLCNVISTHHEPDYYIMQRFVDYLGEARDISASVSKLHKLCIPFCSLAAGVLGIVPDEEPFQGEPTYDGERKQSEASHSPFISTWQDPSPRPPTSHPSTLVQNQHLDTSTHNNIPLQPD
ncbi:hypothetical protein BJ875DRAFT_487310 [Amylocarpus encephaloides]|uniref:Xylanolytic transcriptional activator regulatory domain-containing protein n=1 Tax=Amylocarpus encephaloides TaxID=45428 RepID=A0A9P7YCB8_9HELO|nr:hypothetical protein BJ875DRAFT_487310 [Amylocarpus encephaloides]